jgi:hypothetical protein
MTARKLLRRLKCYLKAIPFFLRSGQWIPHMNTCEYKKAIIIADENSFRVSNRYEHQIGETVYDNACLITYTCTCCGHKSYAWYPSWEERFRLEE